jgi:hypothetical protein
LDSPYYPVPGKEDVRQVPTVVDAIVNKA